ncbi:MAG: TIGR02757 family protein [Bacteroidota bacterium]|nr:TIGR02757 family protein [Bacteroidota bacterium]
MNHKELKLFLNKQVKHYQIPRFIENDPVGIPHLFSQNADIEIMGFFAALFAWGQRKTIIQKSKELIARMDGRPYDFMVNHQEQDLKNMVGFKHRTFNDTDLLYFIAFLKSHYQKSGSLESAFLKGYSENDENIQSSLNGFRIYFFSLPDAPPRTFKHISSPLQNSACKRLSMFLRWMVRTDQTGVDFGIWKTIKPAQLICPLDLHVARVARKLGLLTRTQNDWKAALELTHNLKRFDAHDPVKYDFALFGLGVEGEM